MKRVYKEVCTFDEGRIFNGDEIVGIPRAAWCQLDALEGTLQKKLYLDDQPKYSPGPSLDGFKRHYKYKKTVRLSADTPLLDKKVAEGRKLLDEIRAKNCCEQSEEMLADLEEAIEFAASDYIIDEGLVCAEKCDWPCLGNPLEITVDDIVKAVGVICCDDDLLGKLGIRKED